MFAAVKAPTEQWSTTLLILMFIAMGGWSSNHWALSQTLAGAGTAGKWTHQNCVGNFAGIVAPYVTGYALDKTHNFLAAFAIASGMLLMAVVSYWFELACLLADFPSGRQPGAPAVLLKVITYIP